MAALTEADMKSLYRLMYVIEQMRSPDSGWPEDGIATPDALLPYVEDEAHDVLASLQGHQAPTTLQPLAAIARAEQVWDGYFTIRLLAPWLIWCVARASYVVMQLMEGLVVSVAASDQIWQTGIFRLVPVLALETASQTFPIDLATGQLLWPQMADSTKIQSEDCQLCRDAVSLSDLMQGLIDQILRTTPGLVPLVQRLPVDALIPGQGWQAGHIRLCLTAEFVVDADDMVIDRMLASEVLNTMADVGLMTPDFSVGSSLPTTMRQPLVRLTDDRWLERYTPTLIRESLIREPSENRASLIASLVESSDASSSISSEAIAQPDLSQSTQTLVSVVSDAWLLNDILRDSLTSSSYNSLHQTLRLNELVMRLMWCVSRSAFDVMELMGGVSANVLQPKLPWMSGTLRLLMTLELQTPELSWQVDLATGRSPNLDMTALEEMAIVQSAQSQWCQQATLVKDLQDTLLKYVWHHHPELTLLFEGATADVLISGHDWQPCSIRLKPSLELMPDLRGSAS